MIAGLHLWGTVLRSATPFFTGRSPYWMDAPRDRLARTRVRLFAGVHDGYTGSVPITQSLRFYNKLVDEAGLGGADDRVRDDEIIHLLSHRTAPAPTDRRLGDRAVLLYRRAGPLDVTIFEGGHEMLDDIALDLLDPDAASSTPMPR